MPAFDRGRFAAVIPGKPLHVPADAAIAVAQGALWVTSVADGDLGAPGKDTVARIDLATGRTAATITVPRAPLDLAATPGAVWVSVANPGTLLRIAATCG